MVRCLRKIVSVLIKLQIYLSYMTIPIILEVFPFSYSHFITTVFYSNSLNMLLQAGFPALLRPPWRVDSFLWPRSTFLSLSLKLSKHF